MSVEDDILQLQADVTALTASLESIRQSLQDQIDLNETSAADADTTADAAVADTVINAQDITALDISLRLYIDSKIAQLRTDYASDFAATLASVEPQIESDVTTSFTSQITSLNSTITVQTNAAANSAYNANQSYLNASNVFTSLTQTDIPALQARVTATEGTIATHTSDWQSLLSQYGYTSLQQGFDAQVISTNSAISASANTLKAEIEDPAGTSLGATLNSLYRTEVDTDTAIATEISNVKAVIEDPNGTSLGATVNTQSLAITDLENNASAGFLIEAQVDSNGNPAAVSLLSLIAADDPTTGPVSIAKLQANDILLDGTVSARKLQITDFTDYAQDQKLENTDWADYWTLNQLYGTITHSTGTGFLNNNALVFGIKSPAGSSTTVRAEFTVAVEPNEHYEIQIWSKRSSNYAPMSGGTWGDSYLKVSKTHNNAALNIITVSGGTTSSASSLPIDPQLSVPTDFHLIRGTIEVPDDTDELTFKFYLPHSAGTISLSSPKLVRKLGGELIVEGSITANVLDVQDLSAITADMGIITAGVLQSTDQKFTIDLTNKTISIET